MHEVLIGLALFIGSAMVLGGSLRTLHGHAYSADRLRVLCIATLLTSAGMVVLCVGRGGIDHAARFYLLASLDLVIAAVVFKMASNRRAIGT